MSELRYLGTTVAIPIHRTRELKTVKDNNYKLDAFLFTFDDFLSAVELRDRTNELSSWYKISDRALRRVRTDDS